MLKDLVFLLTITVLLSAGQASAFSMSNTSYVISDAVVSSGGGTSTNASYRLDMSVGQPIAGTSTNASYLLYFGRVWQFISSLIEMESGVQIDSNSMYLTLGTSGRIIVTVSNGASTSKNFPIHIGSLDQSKNWAWFTGHRTDENRYDMNLTLAPYEKRTISIDFFGAVPGVYQLAIGPDNDYAHRYDDVSLKVVYRNKGIFSNTPDIGPFAFALIALGAALMSAAFGRKKP